MPARGKILVLFTILLIISLFFPPKVFSQIVINEIEPYGEWVELYKTEEGEASLNGCVIYFHNSTTTTQKKEFNSEDKFLENEFFKKIETNSTWLANNGDTVILICPWGQDIVSYGPGGIVDNPPLNKSVGRYPDGNSNLFVLDKPTPLEPNLYTCPTYTSTPTPTLISTPTPTSILKATYKINEVKDKSGNVLSSVKIYVDGFYIHHYAPETLVFCDGCKCDTYVDCGFGNHIVELQKTGYLDWNEEINIKSGDNLEVNPVMEREESNLPTSISTPTPTLTPTPKPTPTLKITPTEATRSGEILGEEEEATVGGFYPLEATEEGKEIKEATQTGKRNSKNKILGVIFLGAGLVAIFGAAFSLWYTKLK